MAEIQPPLIPAHMFFFFLLHILSIAPLPFSRASILPLTLLSLFFFCSHRLCFTDGKTRGDGSYAKHISNECWAATMKKASKTGRQILILLFLGGKSCVADSKKGERKIISRYKERT